MTENFVLNTTIFRFFYSLSNQNTLLDKFFIFSAEYLIFIIIIVYLFFFLKLMWKDKILKLMEFILYFSGAILAYLITQILKYTIDAERPFALIDNLNNLLYHPNALNSFPSGHTTLAFAFAVSVFLYNKKTGALLLILAFLVATSRIIVGVHFPIDILVGSIIGISSPITVKWFLTKK